MSASCHGWNTFFPSFSTPMVWSLLSALSSGTSPISLPHHLVSIWGGMVIVANVFVTEVSSMGWLHGQQQLIKPSVTPGLEVDTAHYSECSAHCALKQWEWGSRRSTTCWKESQWKFQVRMEHRFCKENNEKLIALTAHSQTRHILIFSLLWE